MASPNTALTTAVLQDPFLKLLLATASQWSYTESDESGNPSSSSTSSSASPSSLSSSSTSAADSSGQSRATANSTAATGGIHSKHARNGGRRASVAIVLRLCPTAKLPSHAPSHAAASPHQHGPGQATGPRTPSIPLSSSASSILEKYGFLKSSTPSPAASPAPAASSLPPPSADDWKDRLASSAAEILYLKRVERRNDPFSGDVCFPGGHCDEGETDLDAAIRETLEETGLDINPHSPSPRFMLVGQLRPHRAGRSKRYHVNVFVFLQLAPQTPRMLLQQKEIAAYRWVPVSAFVPRPMSVSSPASSVVDWFEFHLWPTSIFGRLLSAVGINPLILPCVFLPNSTHAADGHGAGEDAAGTSADTAAVFRLWGLSLNVTSQLLSTVKRPPLNEPMFLASSPYWNAIFRATARATKKNIPSIRIAAMAGILIPLFLVGALGAIYFACFRE